MAGFAVNPVSSYTRALAGKRAAKGAQEQADGGVRAPVLAVYLGA